LLKSKHEWDRYYSKYLQEKIKKRTTDAISEVLSKEWEQSIEAVDSEDQEQLNVVQKIKNELAERWIDPVFMELITEENEWEVNIQDVKDKFDEYKEKNKESNISFDDILEVFKQSWVECIWKLDEEEWNTDLEDWSTIEEYSKENLWRIQKYLLLNNW
jgi:transcriptional regulator with PAS, ATPase and Fis domain